LHALSGMRSVPGALYLATTLSVATWLRFVVWLVIGLVLYLGYGRRHSRVSQRGVVNRAAPDPVR
jgi:basic amino acid/polyamine antiporter, APA family